LRAGEGTAPDYADDLALIRLKILERQERYQEYLYLAQAEGQTQQYLTMLGHLGRTSEAMQAAQTEMTSMEQAFALAQVLREKGSVIEALKIAQAGLILPGHCQYDLATWTSELAEALGDREIALAASIKAFQAKPSFKDYQKAEELAGEDWSTLKVELLDYLRHYRGWEAQQAKVDIFLHEGFIEDAITVVGDPYFYNTSLIHRVMDAAIKERPDWVIENACRRAESIMDAGKSEHYDDAIKWLRKARSAYSQGRQQSDWSIYRANLMQAHARKYKLMAMLKQQDLD
ncbi:MAG: SWIM zinc finger family protein, partial [Microcystaceae cyanobacterium]